MSGENGFGRREFLAMGAAGTLASACSGNKGQTSKRVAVIGAGIIGASIAYHLTKAGAQVTVFDRGEVAGRASRGTFAWLNATWAKQPRHYHRLNQLGLAGWQELEQDLQIPIKWGGSVEWFDDAERQQRLSRDIEEQIEWGEPAQMVSGEAMQALEPMVAFGKTPSIAFSPNDGALDPVLAAQMLIEAAKANGARVQTNCEVTQVDEYSHADGLLLQTPNGEFEADRFVLATGADPAAVQTLAGIDIPQRSSPGVIVVTKPHEPVLERILVAPGVHIHQRLDGRIVLGEQDGAPDNEAHAMRLKDRPTRFPSPEFAEQHARRILDVAEQYLPAIAGAQVEEVVIGWRPLPLDGHPVMGFSPKRPSAYLAITHSGVSLAPILGRLAAQEILEDVSHETLKPYRPDRSFAEIRRY